MARWSKWCPGKCGKSAYFVGKKPNGLEYYCDRCGKDYTKKQIEEMN